MLNIYNFFDEPDGLSNFNQFKTIEEYLVDEDKVHPTPEDLNNLKQFESYIASDAHLSYQYAYLLNDRFLSGEKVIINDPLYAVIYARDILGWARWKQAEENILQNPHAAYEYAHYILDNRWEEAEEYIKKSPRFAYLYAKNILKQPWDEAESTIKEDPYFWSMYQKYFDKE